MTYPSPERPEAGAPAVEISAHPDDTSESRDLLPMLGGFAVFAALAVALMVGDTWQEQVVARTSGRRSGIAQLLADFGQLPTVATLGAIALLFGFLTVRAFIAARREG